MNGQKSGNSSRLLLVHGNRTNMGRQNQKANWVFTYNNYDVMPRFNKEHMKWLRFGEEVGASGTPHLQGCIQFKTPQTGPNLFAKKIGAWVKKCHWEPMRGAIASNVEYTGKDASAEAGTLHEFGTRPLTNSERRKKGRESNKEKYLEIIAHAKKGDFKWIQDNHPGDWIRMRKNIKGIHEDEVAANETQTHDVLENWWIFGETGEGKSRAVNELVPRDKVYRKMQNKWWDGYTGQPYVVIDDFDPGWTGKAALKQWTDHYSTPVETKGGYMQINPKHFLITSNYKIEECEFKPNDVAPIRRRFKSCNAEYFRTHFKPE